MEKFLIIAILAFLFCGCTGKEKKLTYAGLLEGTVTNIPALSGGKVTLLNKKEGDSLLKNELLGTTDSTDFVLQKEQLLASLAELKAQLASAKISSALAENELDYATEKEKRISNLYQGKSIDRQALDDVSLAQKKASNARLLALEKEKILQASFQKLQAQIRQVQKKIDDCRIYALNDAILTNYYYELGEVALPNVPFAEIVSTKTVELKIYINAALLPAIRPGETLIVTADGDPQKYEGHVSWISPQAEFTPKNVLTPENRAALTYAVTLKIDNPAGKLKHGMPAEAVLP